jgi:hypothetical protein
MISQNSILRRLPPQLNRKQALFFDGIRHAVEIIDLAYSRLQSTLTAIALANHSSPTQGNSFTAAFLDAWALVDAIDRFRALWDLMPNAKKGNVLPGTKSFKELSQPVRDLRNVADHLAQRADYVVARKGAALGELSWYTALNPQGTEGLSCIIVPGTIGPGERQLVNPAGKESTYPTGMIHLAAGGYSACLSDLLPEIERRVRSLEDALERSFAEQGLEGQQAGADILVAMHMSAKPHTSSGEVQK